jgi:GT2 family glycosyltransferase
VEQVGVALVNWNGAAFIGRCLDALLAQSCRPQRIVVVDNNSTDGSPELIRRAYPDVVLLENSTNLGFAAGSNRAIAACATEHVLVLNTDVFLEADFIERLLPEFEQSPRIGALTGEVFEEATGTRISGGFFMRRMLRMRPSQTLDRPEEVFGASGALVLFRREALEDIKVEDEYFDSSYFMYGEDIDLAWRAQLMGWETHFVPGARARHLGSGSQQGRMAFLGKAAPLQRHTLKNRYLTVIKNASVGVLLYLLPSFVLTEPLVWIYLFLRRPLRTLYLLLAWADVVRLLPQVWRRRQVIQRRRRVGPARIRRFFSGF